MYIYPLTYCNEGIFATTNDLQICHFTKDIMNFAPVAARGPSQ